MSITRKSIVIAIIAGILVICDGIITKILNQNASFTWIAFVSWTVFFNSTTNERKKAIIGYIIGFLAAFSIVQLGALFNNLPISLFGIVTIGSILATMIINYLCIELEKIGKFFPISISGIFVGIAMTFSGLGINLSPNTLNNSILMLVIIVIYGILGLLSGWATLKFSTKKINSLKTVDIINSFYIINFYKY